MIQERRDQVALTRAVEARGRAALPSDTLVRRLTCAAALAGGLVAAIGALVIVGWILGVSALTRVAPGQVTMKFTTASSLIATGSAIALAAYSRLTGDHRSRRTAVALMVLVGVVAAGTLVEDAFHLRSPLDNPFGLDPGDRYSSVPGRMAQMTAMSLIGLALAVVLTARNLVRAGQAVAIFVTTVGATAVIGYAYGVQSLYRVGPFSTMALPTGSAVLLAGVAVIFLRPGEGFVSLMVGNTAGGDIVRRLLPWVVIAPNAAGAAIVVGLRRGEYEGPLALAMLVTVVTTAGTGLVWFQGDRLREVDLRRGGAEDALALAREALAERDLAQRDLEVSERRTRRILATAADAYVAVDAASRITEWNQAATELFGWSRSQALGRSLEELILPAETVAGDHAAPGGSWLTAQVSLLGRPRELEACTRSGAPITVEVTVWDDQDPEARVFHAFIRDIGERKRAEQELRTANADLSEFAAIAAHDLRSPLATIQMQVELLLTEVGDDASGPELESWIERIGSTAQRGVSLIDELLDYVQIGRDGHPFVRVDLEALARDVAERETAAGRGGSCRVEALPAVAGDQNMLDQLLANLVGNALKYVPPDRTPQVVVDAVASANGRHCIVRVTDNGDGFATDEREQVFGMFQRGRTATGVPGTGIGLAICRRVAERHGGRIWIEDAPAGGSRVCVELPVWTGTPDGAAQN
jgi:PAS domain S-box-containing protein